MTLEELEVKYAEQKKELDELKAQNKELNEKHTQLQSDYTELQKANNKLFMMVDNPAPKENEGEKEETPEEHEQNVEDTLYDAIINKGGNK